MGHLRALFATLVCASLTVLSVASPASAQEITANVKERTCTVTDQSQAPVTKFWEALEADVRAQRIDEYDHVDPGLKAAIEAYIHHDPTAPSADDIQKRMDATGSTEGLAMLLPQDFSPGPGSDPDLDTPAKSTYTYDEALKTISAVDDDPATKLLTHLQQAAGTSRIDQIRAELFAKRTGEFNDAQHQLRDDFQQCVDEITKHDPWPMHYWVFGALTAGAVLALGFRAWFNSRKPSRHALAKNK